MNVVSTMRYSRASYMSSNPMPTAVGTEAPDFQQLYLRSLEGRSRRVSPPEEIVDEQASGVRRRLDVPRRDRAGAYASP